MPRRCRFCAMDSATRARVDSDIIAGVPWQRIAEKHGGSTGSIGRHKRHILSLVAEASARKQADQESYQSQLAKQVDELRVRAMGLLDKAETAGSLALALQSIREARESIKLLANLTGELAQAGTVNVTLINSPEWIALSQKILKALECHPDARLDVLRALGATIPDVPALPAPSEITTEE